MTVITQPVVVLVSPGQRVGAAEKSVCRRKSALFLPVPAPAASRVPYSIPAETLGATTCSCERCLACYGYRRGLTSWFKIKKESLKLVQIRKRGDGGYATRWRLRERGRKKRFTPPPQMQPPVPRFAIGSGSVKKNPNSRQTLLIYGSFPSPANYCNRNVLFFKKKKKKKRGIICALLPPSGGSFAGSRARAPSSP